VVHDYYYDDDEYDDDGGARRWLKVVAIGLVVALVVGAGFWIVNRGGEEPGGDALFAPATEVTVNDGADPSVASVSPAGESSPSAPPTVSGATGSPTPASTAPSAAATSVCATSVAPTSVTDSSVAVEPPPRSGQTSPASTAATADGTGYPSSADGTPLPILVTYDADTITLTGFVPSQAAKDRLGVLALANSKTEARLENNLVINPDVPIGVGVRVMELNSARFPEGSAELLPAHASEFVRVAEFMLAVPNVTAVVIGHADQRGDEAGNYEISAERAEAVVDFLIYLGVSPTRLSSRAVGEADLLTLGDDDTALALNRRTEFIFYGLLVG
jgi:outer membrane protein OmpA-like peptidoglycan-associated protein